MSVVNNITTDMNKDIVLIPGALATSNLWKALDNHLPQSVRRHHVNVLQCPSISDMASRFVKIAPEKFTLVGFSMGGYVALELFRYIPQKIEKLILINTAATETSAQGRIDRKRSLELIQKGKFDLLISLIFKKSIHDIRKHSEILPLVQRMAQDIGANNYHNQLKAMINKPDQSDLLPLIECPTLLIAGENDEVMLNCHSRHLADNIKDSNLIYLKNCGHLAMLEQPEKLNQLVSNWL
ncbi:alpha/beta fold hydrolase [Legionella sp. CNM-4043-24]|uniref:alpha/beta fold hydrolase n=1 Tax=Legionella sp. CNM-4043-24 TaxID=3421646 RepID=UPI00403B11A7